MNNEFWIVKDDKGIYGYFLDLANAERCAEYFENEVYGDLCEPDKIHIYIHFYTFDDFYWTE